MKGQIEEQIGEIEAARAAFTEGITKCPKSIPLWLQWSSLEERHKRITKSRAVMEKARVKNPNNPELL